jgi:hypothetical protein
MRGVTGFLLRSVTIPLHSIVRPSRLGKTKIRDNAAVPVDSCDVHGSGRHQMTVEIEGEDPADPSANALVHFGSRSGRS